MIRNLMGAQLGLWCEVGVHEWIVMRSGNLIYCRCCSLTMNMKTLQRYQAGMTMKKPLPKVLGKGWPTVF
jgi:hypothetical protein